MLASVSHGLKSPMIKGTGQMKFNVVAPASSDPADVETVILGPGNLAQIELTLYK